VKLLVLSIYVIPSLCHVTQTYVFNMSEVMVIRVTFHCVYVLTNLITRKTDHNKLMFGVQIFHDLSNTQSLEPLNITEIGH